MTSIYSALSDFVRQGRPVSLATVTSSQLAELRPGAKMLIPGDGSPPIGSIHPDFDAFILDAAAQLLIGERSETVNYEVVGSRVEVFIESFPPPQHLIIIGAVHIAVSLSRLAKMHGYRVSVVDPRGVFATRDRFPEADHLIVEWPQEALSGLDISRSTYVVVLTHDPKLDLPALMHALNSDARYVGAIGSRSTTQQRKADLAEMGATDEQLARIHAPVGLDIGALTPAEIAVAIMAQIVAVRRGKMP